MRSAPHDWNNIVGDNSGTAVQVRQSEQGTKLMNCNGVLASISKRTRSVLEIGQGV